MTGAALCIAAAAYIAGSAAVSLFKGDWGEVFGVTIHIAVFSASLWFLWL